MEKKKFGTLRFLAYMAVTLFGLYVIANTFGHSHTVTHLSDSEISELIYEQSIPTPWR